jgi:DNA-binding MarR family transcriptional regulator
MSLKFTRMVARRSKGLSTKAGNVLRVLAERADNNGRCWPSQDTIAEDANVSSRTAFAALKELEAAGWIERERRQRRDGSRTSDMITIRDEEGIARHVEAMLRLPLMVAINGGQAVDSSGDKAKSNSQDLRLGQLARFATHEPITSIDTRTYHLRGGLPVDDGITPPAVTPARKRA